MNEKPLTDAERDKLRLIIGDTPDLVARAFAWCQRNNAEVQFGKDQFICHRGAEVLASARDLGVLVAELERMEAEPGPH